MTWSGMRTMKEQQRGSLRVTSWKNGNRLGHYYGSMGSVCFPRRYYDPHVDPILPI